ncbi:hypothetical protein [Kistimonas asteriae]|uniref:hypothetical protein n=1 Tax=Kistimonas asteriae TaxID=517724 RepID=UPI001BADDACD|nr:hypothetical protein [Kistimonas asteriae]
MDDNKLAFSEVYSLMPQLFISFLFVTAYFIIIGAIIYVEASDELNMQKGENSFMDQIDILIGVLTAGVGQVLNFWLSVNGNGK